MANLIYVANTSLDGYTEDKDGKFDWTDPSDELFRFITDLVRATRTHLYGRRMYETMMAGLLHLKIRQLAAIEAFAS
jgi:dihydrofolate reductase